MFSRKTKVSCYKSEINKSVMLHEYRFTVFDKTQKYPVTNKSIALRL